MHNEETSSKSNQHEAELCVRLCRYLLQQGYPPETVTILTAYSGQVLTFKNIMKKERIFYQGERSVSLAPKTLRRGSRASTVSVRFVVVVVVAKNAI